jgi:hypothetical protein
MPKPSSEMAWWNLKFGFQLLAFAAIWFAILMWLALQTGDSAAPLGYQVGIVIFSFSLGTGAAMVISCLLARFLNRIS